MEGCKSWSVVRTQAGQCLWWSWLSAPPAQPLGNLWQVSSRYALAGATALSHPWLDRACGEPTCRHLVGPEPEHSAGVCRGV